MGTETYDVIMLSHNTKEITKKAIEELHLNTYNAFNLYVLDNNSTDGSIEMLKEFESKKLLTLILSDKNLGFGKGNNLIFNSIQKHNNITLFINSDTEVSQYFDKQPLNFLIDNRIAGIVGSSSDNVGAIDNPQRIKVIDKDTYINYKGYENKFSSNNIIEIDRVSGFCFFIKTELYKLLNGFDENFFAYFEDDDLSIRVKDKGYKIYCIYKSFVKHIMSASSKNQTENERIFQDSKRYFLSKYPNATTAR